MTFTNKSHVVRAKLESQFWWVLISLSLIRKTTEVPMKYHRGQVTQILSRFCPELAILVSVKSMNKGNEETRGLPVSLTVLKVGP